MFNNLQTASNRRIGLISTLSVILILVIAIGCARKFTRERTVWLPYDKNSNSQTKGDITVERHTLNALPPDLVLADRKEPNTGRQLPDIYLVPILGIMEKISITNNTDHVLRLGNTLFRAFDPAGNHYQVLSKDEVTSIVYSQLTPQMKAVQDYPIINSKLRSMKLIDRNTELLPNYTTTGYVFFLPDNIKMSGIWKLVIYDIPTVTDEAGIALKTVDFEFRTISKRYMDYYESGEKVRSVEIK